MDSLKLDTSCTALSRRRPSSNAWWRSVSWRPKRSAVATSTARWRRRSCPLYLILDVGMSPSATGWLMAPMGLGMVFTYPWVARLTQRLGIRGTSLRGALIAFLGTLPFLYLSAKHFSLGILAVTLFVRGMGMSAVGIPSISAAYASVRKEELPMATTSLNIVQRLGGPTLTTVCATFLGWRLAVVHSEGMSSAFTMSFVLLCIF